MSEKNTPHWNLGKIFEKDQEKNPMPPEKAEEIRKKLGLAPAFREGLCPLCGEHFNYGSFELIDEGGVYEWTCPGCGATGKEGYDLVFDGNHYDVCRADGTLVDMDTLTQKEE